MGSFATDCTIYWLYKAQSALLSMWDDLKEYGDTKLNNIT